MALPMYRSPQPAALPVTRFAASESHQHQGLWRRVGQWVVPVVALPIVGCAPDEMGETASLAPQGAPADAGPITAEPAPMETAAPAPSPSQTTAPAPSTEPTTAPPLVEEVPPELTRDAGVSCVSASATTELPSVKLLMLLDTSGSVRDPIWTPMKQALKAFFADPEAAGLKASLARFPHPDARGFAPECSIEAYSQPDVPLAALPEPEAFATYIDTLIPDHGTPTTNALAGLLNQAEAELGKEPDANIILVLVTDGEPDGCYGTPEGMVNSVDTAAEAIAGFSNRFPTFVIGIGSHLRDLNRMANAGGTGDATLIDVADPEATGQDLLAQLTEIRRAIVACDVAFPEAPDGRTIDPTQITTVVNWPNGDSAEIVYDSTCATGAGWSYDDINNPTRINLCPRTCEIMNREEATFEVVFGCRKNPQIEVPR